MYSAARAVGSSSRPSAPTRDDWPDGCGEAVLQRAIGQRRVVQPLSGILRDHAEIDDGDLLVSQLLQRRQIVWVEMEGPGPDRSDAGPAPAGAR